MAAPSSSSWSIDDILSRLPSFAASTQQPPQPSSRGVSAAGGDTGSSSIRGGNSSASAAPESEDASSSSASAPAQQKQQPPRQDPEHPGGHGQERRTRGQAGRRGRPTPPPGYILHEVGAATESAAAVAVAHGMSTAELRRVNHLAAGYVFPGQLLCVRDPAAATAAAAAAAAEETNATGTEAAAVPDHTDVMAAARLVAMSSRRVEGLDGSQDSFAAAKAAGTEAAAAAVPASRALRRLASYARQSTTMSAAVSDAHGLTEGEFVNGSIIRLRAMYVTDGLGMIPGVVECTCDYGGCGA